MCWYSATRFTNVSTSLGFYINEEEKVEHSCTVKMEHKQVPRGMWLYLLHGLEEELFGVLGLVGLVEPLEMN
jgi:hypothetical protein